jgi:hypothetical protein
LINPTRDAETRRPEPKASKRCTERREAVSQVSIVPRSSATTVVGVKGWNTKHEGAGRPAGRVAFDDAEADADASDDADDPETVSLGKVPRTDRDPNPPSKKHDARDSARRLRDRTSVV